MAASVCLRVVIALQSLGIAGRYLLSANETESDVYGYLYFDLGIPESMAQAIDDVGAGGCLLSASVLLANGLLVGIGSSLHSRFRKPSAVRWLDRAALLWVAAWSIVMAAAHTVRGDAFAELSFGEYAVRFAAPVAFMLILAARNVSATNRRTKVAFWMLSIGAAATFAVHGYKAIGSYGPFVDLILLTDSRLWHFEVSQLTAERCLLVIGWVDLLVAAMLLLWRWPSAAIYMTVWGLLTSVSRLTAYGETAWPETLIRAANWGVPLAVLLLGVSLRSVTENTENRDAAINVRESSG